jgi:KaiC/GvpD/RAD55 family RecA-like ATPase
MYIEIVKESPKNRGALIKEEELRNWINAYGKKVPLYRSVYRYPEEIIEYVKKEGTTRMYFGIHSLSSVPIDVDKGENTDNHTLETFKAILVSLEEEGLSEENFQAYFSGTGYHLEIHAKCFGFKDSPELPYIVKGTMEKISDLIDVSIYKRTSIIRCPYSINHKSGLYKVPLTLSEVFNKSPEEIKELAKTQRQFEFEKKTGNGELEHLVISEIPSIKEKRNINEPIKIATCIQKMYNQGPVQGERNNTVLRITSHFRRCGIPSSACKAALLAWNNGSLEPNLIEEKVEYVYNSNYKYGCNDSLLKKYCNTKCIYYARKDYSVDVFNSDQMQGQLIDWLETDWNGKIIDLSKLLFPYNSPNYHRDDLIIYPGELVTIFGPTGTNKTALALNLILGYNGFSDKIHTEYHIPTLFLSLELSSRNIHQRNLQIVSNTDRYTLAKGAKALYKNHKKELDHIIVQTISPTIKQISEKIRELSPLCVVIDYIELINIGSYNLTEKISQISHTLRNMAVNLDIIIIQLSQVGRDSARKDTERTIDLYSGKGSGSIEDASSKVIGINSQANEIRRKIELFKNSDGGLFKTELEWTPTWRLKGIKEEL